MSTLECRLPWKRYASVNRLGEDKQLQLLKSLCVGNGVRATALLVGCDTGTVMAYLTRFGVALRALHHTKVLRLEPTRLEIDEVWAYVYGKNRNRKRFSQKAPEFAGDYFTWTALDPDTKLLVSYYVSRRTIRDALWFLSDVRYRVRGEPLITTDALALYERAVRYVFPHSFHVILHKTFKSFWNRETGERTTKVVSIKKTCSKPGAPFHLATTSYNERHNATVRNFMSRFTRQGYTFSKDLDNHFHAHAIYAAYYNFVKDHRSLGSLTPAMMAKVATAPWTFEDLLSEVDSFWTKAEPIPPTAPVAVADGHSLTPLPPGTASPTHSYFVCNDTVANKAKVHAGSCRNCRHGLGRGGSGKTNQWYAFSTQADAQAAADELAPDDSSVCAMCVRGFYRLRRG